jgi:SAM-dependent methyltransferase
MNIQTPKPIFDETKAEAFAERLVGTLGAASLALMTSMGHRTGLFDTLASLPPATSETLAAKADLSERYVREWLAVMVTSRVVDYDPETETGAYSLPAEHAAFLTRAAGPDNIAVTAQFIGVAASVEEEMLARFRSGEGLHYRHFERFHEVMAEDSGQLVVAALTDHILPIVPGLTERLDQGIEAVDIGCGGGRALLRLAEAFPESRFLGVDLCADAFAEAQVETARRGLCNLTFEARDLSGVETLGQFDLVTAFDAVHDQRDPKALLTMVRRSLHRDGVFLMQDIGGSRQLENNIGNPFAPLLYTLSLMHCTPISIGQGGPGLGTMWGVETAQEYLAAAGFGAVETHRLPHDPINAYFVARA